MSPTAHWAYGYIYQLYMHEHIKNMPFKAMRMQNPKTFPFP